MPVPFRELADLYGNEPDVIICAVCLPLFSREAAHAPAAEPAWPLVAAQREREPGAVAASY
jgi:hypothetical protein